MLQITNLTKAYGRQQLFDDVNFTVNPGERIGLVGRNGHGKTTLFRIIMGDEHPDNGSVILSNHYRTGCISQNISFSQDTVLKEGCLGLMPSENGSDETYRVEATLSGLGFSADDFSRHPGELSGGFQVRLNLVKLLVSEPNLLLLDEPTNYLDIVSVRWLTRFLRSWKSELMLITHDREFMDSVTTHTMGIHRCRIWKIQGPTEKLYGQILMEEEVYEKTRINEQKKRLEVEQFINRFRAQATKARAVQSKIKALQKREALEKQAAIKDLDFQFLSAPFTGKRLIEASNISFSFDHDGPPLIEGLSLSVGRKDRIGIIGKNGRGKTTLLNLLAGELTPAEGTVTHHTSLKMGYFGQTNINRLDMNNAIEDEILKVMPEHNRGRARTICGIMMFEGDHGLKKIDKLSGGEKSRVLLGKLLVSPANLLLLDEPTNHLDMESIDSLIEAIESFDGAVLIVTHSEMMLNALATRLVVFDAGRVSVFEGTYEDFLRRVGWSSEGDDRRNGNGVAADGTDAGSTGVSKKELRRSRAELIDERARILGRLNSDISAAENEIVTLEEDMEKDTAALLEASVRSDAATIREYSQSLDAAKKRIDILFEKLAALTEQYETFSKEFEERLNQAEAR